jgi:capsid protein
MGIRNYLQGIGSAIVYRPKMSAADIATKIFQYHAGANAENRLKVAFDPTSEDAVWSEGYELAVARARHLLRNFPVLAWIIDKHLDFTAVFNVEFQCEKTSGEKNKIWSRIDDQLETLFEWWSQAENFDVGKRYSLPHYLRINEAQKVLFGDMGTLKMADGRVMAVASDQIKNGYGSDWQGQNWFRGVRVHSVTGEACAYSFCRRNIDGSLNERELVRVPAGNFYLHAERKHYPNLIRGISPLANALNSIQDCHEGLQWHLIKMKIAAMFGMVLFEDKNAMPNRRIDPDTDEIVQDETKKSKYDIKLNGVTAVSMERGEDLKIIDSKVPSTESQEFYKMVMMVALKALNLPYSFFSEDFTNFYGSRGAVMHYIRASGAPRRGNIDFLNNLLKWRITKWIINGDLILPKGYDVRQIRWQCTPRGIPLWDPSKEMKGVNEQFNAGLDCPQNMAAEIGTNFYKNIEQNKVALELMRTMGVPDPIWAQEQLQKPNKDESEENDGKGK